MSAASLLDELLSGFALPIGGAWPDRTPGKAAKAANRKQPCGLSADSTPCEGLRKSANLGPCYAVTAMESQKFAALRNPGNVLESKQPCGLSQDSQDSQRVHGLRQSGVDLDAMAWTDAEISAFIERRDRLLRWRWKEADAEALAHRLTNRDHDDDRVSCTDCRHYRPERCGNHRQAGLNGTDVGRDLAAMLQRCQGFQQLKPSEAQP